MSEMEKELLEATGAKPQKKNEDRQAYLTRLLYAANKIDEDDFAELNDETQEWVNAGISALNVKDEAADFPGDEDADEEEEEEAPKAKKGKAKKAAVEEDEEDEEEEPAPKAKKAAKGKKAPVVEEDEEDEEDEYEPIKPPKAKKAAKGKKAPVEDEEEEEPAPKAKKGKKAPAVEEDEEEAPKPKAKKGKKAADEDEEDEEEEAPKAKKPAKKAKADGDKKRGGTRRLRELTIENPELKADELAKMLIKEGYEITSVTLNAIYYECRALMRMLDERGMMKKPKAK